MKTFVTCIVITALIAPVATMTNANDVRVIPHKYSTPGNQTEFEKGDRIVDIDEERVPEIIPIPGYGLAPAGAGLEYITSCLWTDCNDIYVEEGIMYCALTYGLVILDVSGDLPFDIISTLYLHTTYGRGDELEKHGDYIYFLRASEVAVIDVSDIYNPLVVGSYPSEAEFEELTCADDVLYLVDDDNVLTILDVSDPADPSLLSTVTDLGGHLQHTAVAGGIAFISADTEFHVLDVSDPANTHVLASRELHYMRRAILRDDLAFAFKIGYADSLIIFNMSDPADPAIIGTHAYSDSDCSSFRMILTDSLLITSGEIIDISDPSTPVPISTYSECFGLGLALWGNSLYRVKGISLINVFDIANIEEPMYVDSHEFPGNTYDMHIRDNLAYVSLLFQGLVILDISDIHNPVVIGEYEDVYDYKCIDVQDDILCNGYEVVDIGDPAAPSVLAALNLGSFPEVLDVRLKDNLTFVARESWEEEGILVFDLSDPRNPVLLSSYQTKFGNHAKVALKDTLAFLSVYNGSESVHIINYANPSSPELIGTYGDKSTMVVAVDEYIMYTELLSDLHVVDIHDPRNPTLIGIFDEFRYWAPKVMIPQGDHLYTTDLYGNTVVFDVSDPQNPLFLENFMTPSSSAENLFIVDDSIFLADRYGLMIVRIPYGEPPAIPVSFDIKPGSCPNPLNWKINPHGKAVLPAAILGSDEFDVHDIDVSSIRLLDDLAAVRYGYEDVATPPDTNSGDCTCSEGGADGYCDLTIKFDKRSILEKLHALPEAEQYALTITGLLVSGEQIEGHDCVHPVGRDANGSDAAGPVADGGSDKARPLVDAAEGVTIRGNYPNPFNPTTGISFYLPEASRVTLDIYNSAGQRIITLADQYYAAGDHTVAWDGRSTSGRHVYSGVYFCRIRTGATTVTKKMVLLR